MLHYLHQLVANCFGAGQVVYREFIWAFSHKIAENNDLKDAKMCNRAAQSSDNSLWDFQYKKSFHSSLLTYITKNIDVHLQNKA